MDAYIVDAHHDGELVRSLVSLSLRRASTSAAKISLLLDGDVPLAGVDCRLEADWCCCGMEGGPDALWACAP